MNGYLLDTNIVIHLANQATRQLPIRLRNLIGKRGEPWFVSTVSVWEFAIKQATGRLQVDVKAAELPEFLDRLSVTLIPMTMDHALEVAHPEPDTKDPFDRLLLAVCACEGMKLLTTDTKLAGHRLVY
jgi:PIN domain nuclease of toxin-antitoxin system